MEKKFRKSLFLFNGVKNEHHSLSCLLHRVSSFNVLTKNLKIFFMQIIREKVAKKHILGITLRTSNEKECAEKEIP